MSDCNITPRLSYCPGVTPRPADQRRTILVTGAAGGLGAAAADRFLAGGWRVAAVDLTVPTLDGANALPLAMDVTDDAAVEDAMRQVEAWAPDGLDAVATFAGIGCIGPLMDVPMSSFQRVLDVNVLGTHRTVRASWRLVERARGRILLIGSEAGWQHALPLNGPYAMSKHAIEAYADTLRRELMFVGVDVVLLQPGPFRSAMTLRIAPVIDAVPDDSPFKPLARAAMPRLVHENARASEPALLAEATYRAATAERPRPRYSVRPHRGRMLLNRLPVPLVDRLLMRALDRSPRNTSPP